MNRDLHRESCFKDEYGIEAQIHSQCWFNPDKTYDRVKIDFMINGKNYSLVEYMKGNATDYVFLLNGMEKLHFDKFIDAEKKLVEILKEK